MPLCGVCGKDRARADFSSSQLRRKSDRRCRDCVCSDSVVDPVVGEGSPLLITEHCLTRLVERRIAPEELALALAHGDRAAQREEDGTARYTYKGVVYIVDEASQVGVTAWRIEPTQCICKIQPDSVRAGDPEPQHGISRKHQIFGQLQIGCMKAVCKHARCGGGVGFCSRCFASVDPLVQFLSSVDFAKPCYRGILGDTTIMGLCLLAACGARLVPQHCDQCHGVRRLTPAVTHGFDEGPAVRWVRHLLDKAACKSQGREKDWPSSSGICGRCGRIGACDGRSCNPIVNFSGLTFMVADGASPLELAVRGGYFRIATELLRFGADRSVLAWRRSVGKSALEELVEKARMEALRELRVEAAAAFYEDILELVLRDYRPPTSQELRFRSKMAPLLPKFGAQLEHLSVLPAEDDGGFLWDGRAWRFFLKGTCDCQEPRCHRKGFPFVSSTSFRQNGDRVLIVDCPPNFVDVATCLKDLKDGSGKTYSVPWQPLSADLFKA